MILKDRYPTALAVAGLLLVGFTNSIAIASIDRMPRLKTECLSSKHVLKTNGGARLADIQPGGKVRLVSVRVCTAERRVCFAQGGEVPMSQCVPTG